MTGPAPGGALPSGSSALLAAFDAEQLTRNGIPDAAAIAARQECHRVLVDTLGAELEALRASPLGPVWTEVFDAYPRRPVPPERLDGLGWVPLDRLAARRRPADREVRLWGVVAGGQLLGAVRVHPGPDAHDPLQILLADCHARAEVRLRTVFELRELLRLGHELPRHERTLQVAAEIESGLGGRDLAPWATGRVAPAPAPLPRTRTNRRVVVAISGVDGAGKSTLRTALTANLDRCGVPVSTVWVRPGMGLGWLVTLAGRAKRLLRQDAAPGFRAMAADQGSQLRSRAGLVGWIWAMLVTIAFLTGVWRQHRAARGVVVYDRHLLDALATLDFAYAGVDLRLPHRLVRSLLPRAGISVYLDVPLEVSVARKPDDLIGASAVGRQLAAYERWLSVVPPTCRLDATRPPQELMTHLLRIIAVGRRNQR
ncbi:MAG: hypothetical protein ACR2JK_11140 [Geodermatophilaceae bacterium]